MSTFLPSFSFMRWGRRRRADPRSRSASSHELQSSGVPNRGGEKATQNNSVPGTRGNWRCNLEMCVATAFLALEVWLATVRMAMGDVYLVAHTSVRA